MKLNLRPYQSECIDKIEERGPGKWLCQLATGMGKTVIFSHLPRHGRTLILSHRQELVRQPVKFFDCPTSIEMGEYHASGSGAEVISASIQTMHTRMKEYSADEFDRIIVDEAHHASSASYRDILGYFKPRQLLGFTATPNRADGVGLECIFDEIIFRKDLKWGIENGYLSRIVAKRVNIGFDLSNVAVRMGDYAPGELERAVNTDKCNKAIAGIIRDLPQGSLPCLVFAVDVKHAVDIAAEINRVFPGYAKALSGMSKDREESVEAFKSGKLKVLVNCNLFTEGTDLPDTRTVIIARPTKSNALYVQMVGRGTRLSEGKTHCLLIDCIGVSNQPLCTAPTLIGLNADDVPHRYQQEIEGDLLDEIPSVMSMKMDTPESWIRNMKNVDLWSKSLGYSLHEVNYQKSPDDSLRLRFPVKKQSRANVSVYLSAPDSLGNVEMVSSSGFRKTMQAQDAYDLVYKTLRTSYADSRPLWDVRSAKRWGNAPASQKQIEYVQKLAKRRKIDCSAVMDGLTKMQAGCLIERMA